jgi:aspartyl protease family protein
MLLRNAVILGVCVGSCASFPLIYQGNPAGMVAAMTRAGEPAAPPQVVETVRHAPAGGTVEAASGRKVEVAADARGHYFGAFKINGRRIDALIDTGATAVAINLSTARKLGIEVRQSDMAQTVSTANGKARATIVMLPRVEIGRISVDNVQALVLEDAALGTTLIGMTFLNRLKRVQVDDRTMALIQ